MESQNLLTQQKRLIVSVYFLMLTCVAALALTMLWKIPSGVSQSTGSRFTPARLAMLAGLALAGTGFLILFFLSLRKKGVPCFIGFIQRSNRTRLSGLLCTGCILSLPFLLTPLERFGPGAAIVERLRPYFLLASWACTSGLALVRAFCSDWSSCSVPRLTGRPLLIFFVIFIAFVTFIALSGWGISAGAEIWYDNGVPLLPHQVAIVLVLVRLLTGLGNQAGLRLLNNRRLWFFVIWVLAAALWQAVPMRRHFFAPGPYPPDNQFYPYSDAMGNDLAAQSALAGLGFNFGGVVFKPVVSFLIYIFTLISGNQMNATLTIQSATFGALPALLFLFVSGETTIFAGLLAAGLQVVHEINALNSDTVLTVHSKLEMSEFLAEILFLLFAWSVFKWLRNNANSRVYAVIAGGILALMVFTRFNFAAMLPAVIPLSLIVLHKNLKRWAVTSLLFLGAFLLALSPWLVRSYQITGKIAPEIFDSFQVVVVDQRLSSIETPQQIQSNTRATEAPSNADVTPTQSPTTEAQAAKVEIMGRQPALRISPIFDTIANHTLHNLSALIFVLPHQVSWDSLSTSYQAENSLWRSPWNGKLTLAQMLMLLLNGTVLSAGLAVLWKKFRWQGMTVLYLTVVYAAALGIARTSGGRYLVPMNWSVIYLYATGLGALLKGEVAEQLVAETSPESTFESIKPIRAIWLPLITLAFAGVYLSMIIIEKVSIPTVVTKSDGQLLQQLTSFKKPDETVSELIAAVREEKVQIYSGKALYSRFYYFNQGESGSDAAFVTQPYSRWVFRLMHPGGFVDVVLPITQIPETIPNASDIVVIGCLNEEKGLIDALAVFAEPSNAETAAYYRKPERPAACPLAEPVCPATNDCY